MIESVICCIIILSLANFYLSYRVGNETSFDRVYNVSLIVLFIHAINVLIAEVGFSTAIYVDLAAPYGLIYGPLCYFSFYTASGKSLSLLRVMFHLTPFLIGLVFYLMILIFPSFREAYSAKGISILYNLFSISLVGYTAVLLLYNNVDENSLIHEGKKMIILVILIVFIVALLIFTVEHTVSNKVNLTYVRMLIYLAMLAIVGVAFRYNVNRGIRKLSKGDQSAEDVNLNIEKTEKQRYQKSAISDAQLSDYQVKLERLMLTERFYLDGELTLEKLAGIINIPKQYLTQVLSLRIGKNFYQYINEFRIEHACELLKKDEVNFKLEEIAMQSGFNSKTSFNRYFKTMTGYTPSEYKSRIVN